MSPLSMLPRRRLLHVGVALILVVASGVTWARADAPDDDSRRAPLNAEAPRFSLRDTEGRTHDLADLRGRIVVLEWTDIDCPFVHRHYKKDGRKDGAMLEAHRRVKAVAPDAVWLAIDSTRGATARSRAAWRAKHGLPYPILLDVDGEVAQRFDARRTMHMCVIDANGVLRYHGAIDDDKHGRKPRSEVTNYVVQAVRQIASGQPVEPGWVKPYGCSIKSAGRKDAAAGATPKR